MKDYNTQRTVETGEGKALVRAVCFNARGQQEGAATSGYMEPRHVAQLISGLSDVLATAPPEWPADRILITVE